MSRIRVGIIPTLIFFFIKKKVWCDVLSHNLHKFNWWLHGPDTYIYSTDVYFNRYPEYTVSFGTYNASFHLLNRRIIKCFSTCLIRNVGLTTTKIENTSPRFLTDIEARQRLCIFFGGWPSDRLYYYLSDRNAVPDNISEPHNEQASYVLSADFNKMFYIHGVRFIINTSLLPPSRILFIYTAPTISLTLYNNSPTVN